jgi:hypothetical protein|tara:strand:- start:1073 stop:1264 length:192 start_codon:yes stop_codon:yes gene_type:complete
MKELFINCHEAAIARYLETHPKATDKEAEDATCNEAYEKMQDKYHDMVDRERDRRKEVLYGEQ